MGAVIKNHRHLNTECGLRRRKYSNPPHIRPLSPLPECWATFLQGINPLFRVQPSSVSASPSFFLGPCLFHAVSKRFFGGKHRFFGTSGAIFARSTSIFRVSAPIFCVSPSTSRVSTSIYDVQKAIYRGIKRISEGQKAFLW